MDEIEIIRKVDDLGRIVIPREIRQKLKIKEGTPMKIYATADTIIIKKGVGGFMGVKKKS